MRRGPHSLGTSASRHIGPSFVTPGQSLAVSAKLLHDGSGFAVTKAEIRHEGKLVCNAELTFRLIPFPNAQLRASMEKVAEQIQYPLEAVPHV